MMKPKLSIGRYACVLSMITPAIAAPTCTARTHEGWVDFSAILVLQSEGRESRGFIFVGGFRAHGVVRYGPSEPFE